MTVEDQRYTGVGHCAAYQVGRVGSTYTREVSVVNWRSSRSNTHRYTSFSSASQYTNAGRSSKSGSRPLPTIVSISACAFRSASGCSTTVKRNDVSTVAVYSRRISQLGHTVRNASVYDTLCLSQLHIRSARREDTTARALTSVNDVRRTLDVGLVRGRHLPVLRVLIKERSEETWPRGTLCL